MIHTEQTAMTQVRQTENRMLNRCVVVAVMKELYLRQPKDYSPRDRE